MSSVLDGAPPGAIGRTATAPIPHAPPDIAGKEQSLEALRGVAAIIVVLYHLLLGFAPGLPGVLPGFPAGATWIGRPWYGLVNGVAAVGFFFTLSGFVLTRRSLQTGHGDSLAVGAIKRWPRLAGTVAIACLSSWALFPLGLYRFRQAGKLSASPWLSAFASTGSGDGLAPNGLTPNGLVPNAWAAFKEGACLTFFTGSATYNSSLWTMHIEFIGSFIAFGLALALLRLPGAGARAALLLTAWLACFCVDPWLANFPLGVALASLAASGRLPRLSAAWLPPLLLAAFASANYVENSALGRLAYAHLRFVPPAASVYGLGAASALLAAECIPALRASLSGRVAAWLGRLSFPLYLLHIPILCSAGCFAYLRAGGGRRGTLAAAIVPLAGTALAAWPLAIFDIWWAALVGRAARRVAFGPAARTCRPPG